MGYNKFFYWSKADKAYITAVPSLPGCMADGKTIDESLRNADETAKEWIKAAEEWGREIPQEDFSDIESSNPSAVDVASYILDYFRAVDTWFIQKMVYYCQAWCLGIYKKPFIHDTFQDFANGPVNRTLLHTHRGKRIINKNDYPITHIFTESEKRHMDNVIAVYGAEDGESLREYTHQEDPWRITRGALKEGEPDHKDISDNLMMEYYHN